MDTTCRHLEVNCWNLWRVLLSKLLVDYLFSRLLRSLLSSELRWPRALPPEFSNARYHSGAWEKIARPTPNSSEKFGNQSTLLDRFFLPYMISRILCKSCIVEVEITNKYESEFLNLPKSDNRNGRTLHWYLFLVQRIVLVFRLITVFRLIIIPLLKDPRWRGLLLD